MPKVNIHWRVQHGSNQFHAQCSLEWPQIPTPGSGVIPCTSCASVVITDVCHHLTGQEADIFLEPHTEASAERYERIQGSLRYAGWTVSID